jgi:4-oxalocrotonate tautomerase
MPHIIVKLVPGRSEQLKATLADQIVKDTASVLQAGEESISLAIEEVESTDWVERVYRPEILNNPKLYKKPGHNPFS